MMTCPKCQEEIGSMSMHYCPLIAEMPAKEKADDRFPLTPCSRSYFPGMDCRCAARSEADCGCPGVDWSPSEIYDLRNMLKEARESLAFRRQLYKRQNALMHEMRERLELELSGLREQVRLTLMENLHLADGDVCTLKRLKDAIGFDLDSPENDQGDGRREKSPNSPPTSSPFHPPSC